jgi:rubrerythrin
MLVGLEHRLSKRLLREVLVRYGYVICHACGYDMRGSPGPKCPECGAAMTPAQLRRSTGMDDSAKPQS